MVEATAPLPPLLLRGDCIIELKRIPDASMDAVVTDPPYGLEFMGKGWDKFTPLDFERWCERWAAECLRILKPGGHLLAFGGTRTWHRLAAGIEDAGFEIRDSIAWLYGSGMPKSLDVSKAIDRLDAAEERMARARRFQSWIRQHLTAKEIDEITGTDMGCHLTTHPTQPAVATAEIFDMLRSHLPEVPAEIEALIVDRIVESENYARRESTGVHERPAPISEWRVKYGHGRVAPASEKKDVPHTDAAREWGGWGTGLKPAFEPIVVARKPLPYGVTVAANVIERGTGALNIDATRIPTTDALARWPANVILDEDSAAVLDGQVAGGPSRFFYVAKASKAERPVGEDGTIHPTVKPLALMRWLVRLVTPPGGVVVDPFAGSGTTLEAAYLEGFESIGIEMTPDYWSLIEARIERVAK